MIFHPAAAFLISESDFGSGLKLPIFEETTRKKVVHNYRSARLGVGYGYGFGYGYGCEYDRAVTVTREVTVSVFGYGFRGPGTITVSNYGLRYD